MLLSSLILATMSKVTGLAICNVAIGLGLVIFCIICPEYVLAIGEIGSEIQLWAILFWVE